MNKTPASWIPCIEQLPPENEIVETVISDENGLRNEALLKRIKSLYWLADGSIYVYYRPTHWRRLNQ